MKKFVAVAVLLATMSAIYAFNITAGLKGTFAMNLGTTLGSGVRKELIADVNSIFPDNFAKATFSSTTDFSQALVVGGGGSVYGRFDLIEAGPGFLGAQVELGLSAQNGSGFFKDMDTMVLLTYVALDIPIMVTYAIPVGGVKIIPGVGANLSIPFSGSAYVKVNPREVVGNSGPKQAYGYSTSKPITVSNFNIGIVGALGVEIPLGPGALLAEARYVNDFTDTIWISTNGSNNFETPLVTRRAAQISVGYQYSFF